LPPQALEQLDLSGQQMEPGALGLPGHMLPLGPWKGLLYSQVRMVASHALALAPAPSHARYEPGAGGSQAVRAALLPPPVPVAQVQDLPAWLLDLPRLCRLTVDQDPHCASGVMDELKRSGVLLPVV
jgi:hypothetical protein